MKENGSIIARRKCKAKKATFMYSFPSPPHFSCYHNLPYHTTHFKCCTFSQDWEYASRTCHNDSSADGTIVLFLLWTTFLIHFISFFHEYTYMHTKILKNENMTYCSQKNSCNSASNIA